MQRESLLEIPPIRLHNPTVLTADCSCGGWAGEREFPLHFRVTAQWLLPYKLWGTLPTQTPAPRHCDTTGVIPENDQRAIEKNTKQGVRVVGSIAVP